jgi:hypothetical protein
VTPQRKVAWATAGLAAALVVGAAVLVRLGLWLAGFDGTTSHLWQAIGIAAVNIIGTVGLAYLFIRLTSRRFAAWCLRQTAPRSDRPEE